MRCFFSFILSCQYLLDNFLNCLLLDVFIAFPPVPLCMLCCLYFANFLLYYGVLSLYAGFISIWSSVVSSVLFTKFS